MMEDQSTASYFRGHYACGGPGQPGWPVPECCPSNMPLLLPIGTWKIISGLAARPGKKARLN